MYIPYDAHRAQPLVPQAAAVTSTTQRASTTMKHVQQLLIDSALATVAVLGSTSTAQLWSCGERRLMVARVKALNCFQLPDVVAQRWRWQATGQRYYNGEILKALKKHNQGFHLPQHCCGSRRSSNLLLCNTFTLTVLRIYSIHTLLPPTSLCVPPLTIQFPFLSFPFLSTTLAAHSCTLMCHIE